MKKFFLSLALTAVAGSAAFAQTDEYKKGEVYVGFSHQQVDTGITPDDDFSEVVGRREPFNGFQVSGVYNISRYVGIKGDISGAYNNTRFSFTLPPSDRVAFDTNNSLYNFLGGVQFKDSASDARVKPFAHVLAGAGHGRVKVKNVDCNPVAVCTGLQGTTSETGFAGAFGGGVDVKLNNRVDLRLIQVDYNPIRFDGATSHNFRFGIGFVFK